MRISTPRRRGFTLLELLIVVAIVALIAAFAIPNMMESRKLANETSCIASLREITTAETLFREGDKERDGNLDYGMLSELQQTELVDGVLGSGTKHGYLFQVSYSTTSPMTLWFGVGTPVLPGATGDRYFATNQAGVIFYTTGAQVSLDTSSCVIPPSLLPIGK